MAVNAPESEGVYSHITKATCANYYITSHLIGPHDVVTKSSLASGIEQGDMKISALFPMGVNVLGRLYIYIITLVSFLIV